MNDLASRGMSPQCPLCRQDFDLYYRTPRIVPKCGHSFCEKCITLRLTVKSNRKVFVCPECQSEVIVRKGVQQDVPKNIGIIDIVKTIRKYGNDLQEDKLNVAEVCSQHGRPLELVCQTCKYCKVCSYCALFGQHKNHSFCKEVPASKIDLTELKNHYEIVTNSVETILLPGGQSNIRVAMKNRVSQGLRKHVAQSFKQYYNAIEKKQFELIQQCDNVVIDQGGIDKNIDSLIQDYDRIKNRYQNQFKVFTELGVTQQKSMKLGIESIDQFISKCTDLHKNLETVEKNANQHIDRLVKSIGIHIMQAAIFKIQELPFSIKRVIEGLSSAKNELPSPDKRSTRLKSASNDPKSKSVIVPDDYKSQAHPQSIDRVGKSQNKNNLNQNVSKGRNNFSQAEKSQSRNDQFSLLDSGNSELEFYKEQPQNRLTQIVPNKNMQNQTIDRGSLPPKQNKTKVFGMGVNDAHSTVTKPKESMIAKSKQSKIKKQLSPPKTVGVVPLNKSSVVIDNNLLQDLKFVRPSKEISFQFLTRFQQLLVQVDRQALLNTSTLQLNSADINDVLILYIVDYLRMKKYFFQVIKLVKNVLTDEGLRIILSFLVMDNTTQLLNLTSNHLTTRSIDIILLFANRNNILRTFYLGNNKISPMQLKNRKSDLAKFQIEINV